MITRWLPKTLTALRRLKAAWKSSAYRMLSCGWIRTFTAPTVMVRDRAKAAPGQQASANRSIVMIARFSESGRKVYVGLQSLRSMRRIDARRMKATAVRVRFSKSLARRRQRLSHARVRSTTQRLGSTSNPLARSDRIARKPPAPIPTARSSASCSPPLDDRAVPVTGWSKGFVNATPSGRLATLSGERGLRERCRACGRFYRGP